MGIIKFIIFKFVPFIGFNTYLALRLGDKLLLSSRQTGRNFGMLFNYFKIILFNLKPKANQSGEIVRMIRGINQQSHAFTRELNSNILSSKKELSEMIPSMKINPFDNIGLKNEEPLKIDKNNLTGIEILKNSILERRRIINKKKKDDFVNKSFYN